MLNKRLNIVAAVFATLWFSGAGHAGVIYNWNTDSLSPTISSVSGQIEVTEAAWLSGSVEAMYNNIGTGAPSLGIDSLAFPTSPLLNFEVAVNGQELRIVPRDPTNNNTGDEFILDVSLTFDGTEPASGSIDANNTESNISFGGFPLWEIDPFATDSDVAGEPCFISPGCSGATGQWQIDTATLPLTAVVVAEPPTALLFLAALALIICFTSRRNAA